MAYAAYNYTITDESGNVVTGCSVEVRREIDNVLVPLYSDRDGALAISNPFTDSTGTGRFHAAGNAYKITASKTGFSRSFRFVPIGLAGETDFTFTTFFGIWDATTTYPLGAYVIYNDVGIFLSTADGNLNNAPDSATPGSTADWVYYPGVVGPQGEPGIIGTWEGPWVTSTVYSINDAVSQSGSSYICIVSHTSGTFSTDLAAGKWELVAQGGEAGAPGVANEINKIINGDFDIWQRGTSQTSNGYGSDDRWVNADTGSTKTASRETFTLGQTDVPGNPKYFSRTVVTSVAASSNYVTKFQKIESVLTLEGKTATLTFWAKADANKNIAVNFRQSFGTGGSPSAAVDTTGGLRALTTAWQKFSFTVAIPSISGKTLGTAANDSLDVEFWFDAGSDFNTRASSLGQQSGTFDIAHVSIVEGDATAQADPFSPRHPQQELALCERYYEKGYDLNTAPGTAFTLGSGFSILGWGTNAGSVANTIFFNTRKRGTPTCVTYDSVGTAAKIDGLNAGVSWSNNVASLQSAQNSIGFTVYSGSSIAGMSMGWTADAEL